MEMWIFGQPMTPTSNSLINDLIRLSIMLSLIFFACTISSCRQSAEKEIRLIWKDDKATSLLIPHHLLPPAAADSMAELLQLRLAGTGKTPIMGTIESADDVVKFTPLVPFSRGLSYAIYFRDEQVGLVKVPLADSAQSPRVLAVYPSNDTLPENLLKFYVQFSKPMRTGQSLNHVFLVDENTDTLRDVFLDLQPELWNPENTVLTIWLDPGRIKRDLIPNKQFGNPLTTGKRYKLLVSDYWKDQQELTLKDGFLKTFFVTGRDQHSPSPANWKLELPAPGSTSALKMIFPESLDYFLLQETIQITDNNGHALPGTIKVMAKERGVEFTPLTTWKPGKFTIVVAPHLEDVAGNNPEKLFDRDLQQQTAPSPLRREFMLLSNSRQP
jgi:hypothetical protein